VKEVKECYIIRSFIASTNIRVMISRKLRVYGKLQTFKWQNLKGGDSLGDLGVDCSIILERP
jgi:hypothetical protein